MDIPPLASLCSSSAGVVIRHLGIEFLDGLLRTITCADGTGAAAAAASSGGSWGAGGGDGTTRKTSQLRVRIWPGIMNVGGCKGVGGGWTGRRGKYTMGVCWILCARAGFAVLGSMMISI